MKLLKGHEVLVGTYEEFVVGLRVTKAEAQPDKVDLTPSFTDHAHSSSVRCLAAKDKFLLSGSSDETIKVYNLRGRRDHGSLMHHDATVNAIQFYDNKYLFTAAEDGKICILKTKDWAVEKTLVMHRAGVTDVSIHPSGKLALSVGKDKKLVTWNLIKGRAAYVSNLYQVADFVKWSPDGTYYVVGFYKRADVYDVSTASVIYTIPLTGRANSAVFLDDDTLILAEDAPEIQFHSIKDKKVIGKLEAHERRVRCMQLVQDETSKALFTASNDGLVKVWNIKLTPNSVDATLIGEHNLKCRITCMTVHKVPEVATPTQKVTDSENVTSELKKKSGKKRKKVTMVEPEKEEEEEEQKVKLVEIQEDSETVETKRPKRKKKKSV